MASELRSSERAFYAVSALLFAASWLQCCSGLIAILLVVGVMDLRAMLVVATAITLERLAPAGESVVRIIGAVIVAIGLFLIARAAGFV